MRTFYIIALVTSSLFLSACGETTVEDQVIYIGDTVSYSTGISVSVTQHEAVYSPESSLDEFSEDTEFVILEIEIVNGTGDVWEPVLETILMVEDVKVASVIDIGHTEFGDLGWRPQDLMAADESVSWFEIYPTVGLDNSTYSFEVSPDFDLDRLTFVSK